MQRIVCRYRRDIYTETHRGPHDIRCLFVAALERAGLPLADTRRNMTMGPPLPPGASSDDERCRFDLRDPVDPHDVCVRVNQSLPDDLHVIDAWIALPERAADDPATLDEAVYLVQWHATTPAREIKARIEEFIARREVWLEREREKRLQRINARALVRQLHLTELSSDQARLIMMVSVGPRGTLRPDEVLRVLGYVATPGQLTVRRLALRRTGRVYAYGKALGAWQRGTQAVSRR